MAIPAAAVLIFSFQNCGSGFQVAQLESESLVDLSAGMEVPITIVDNKNAIVTSATELIVDEEYRITIDKVRIPVGAVVTWNSSVTPGGGVHVHPGLTPRQGELHCEAPGIITVSVTIESGGQTFNSVPRVLSCIPPLIVEPAPTPAPGAEIVTFRIPAGTNQGPWNTLATTVTVFVGQTLRIINDDSIRHRLHTNNAPCNHQNNDSQPGATFDCVVVRPVNASSGSTYDHNIGTAARFYVTAIDGRALYATNCQSCHGAIATSEHRNATAAMIRTQINTRPEMMNLNLTDDQLRAISYSLSR